jgi:hypothetical protein
MADPLALVPLAAAAAGGRYAERDVSALVAAGHTLLQRSAVLVRALATSRSAVVLPVGSAWLTALAASDGRGAVLLDPAAPTATLVARLRNESVGALFTTETLAHGWQETLPPDLVQVWLDRAPAQATVVANGTARPIDLGSHFGLDLVGDTATEGRDEPFVWVDDAWHTHRAILTAARMHAAVQGLTPVHWMPACAHWTLSGLVHQLGVLLQGGRVTMDERAP